ncbi:MAG TPA: MYXO-CTERM sorting domain-containing protein [Polyangia bacterium]|nr:MYXO-CTERM sorting domain-containing protein [Polyangia bacterium]
MPAARRLTLVVCALAATLSGRRADAYVRTLSDNGVPSSWRGTNCLPVVVYPKGFSEMTADEVTTATMAAAAAWSSGENGCTYINLDVMTSSDDGPVAVPQAHAAIIFREGEWCHVEADGGCSADAKENERYDPSALMVTSVVIGVKSGEIIRGSTEVNVKDWGWADLVTHPERASAHTQDFQNALTHELGHFIGLDHTCAEAGTDPWPLDDMGARVPDCNASPPDVQATTMFASAPPGDTEKRTLAPDDQRGVCGIYPVAADPGRCVAPTGMLMATKAGCSCATAETSRAGVLAPVFVTVLMLGRRRRRRHFC